MSFFRCPLCQSPLTRGEHTYTCPSGHSFDCSAAGYVHLLPANRKHSQNPGDDKAMVAARSDFLERGYYAPLRDALCTLAAGDAGDLEAPALLDSGCGEGYYTYGLWQALSQGGRTPEIAGVDISKFALRRAAKRVKAGEFAVASVYQLPMADGRADLLTNVFSPLCPQEFARVVRPGGRFYYVVPSARHLWEMKEVLYARPYENQVRREDYPGFQWLEAVPLRYTVQLDSAKEIMALFGMTPYAWKTPKDGVARLAALEALEVQVGFDVHVYQRRR